MRVIILNLKILATKYCLIFITTIFFITNTSYAAQENFIYNINFSNQSYWEASVTPILDEFPAVDNGDTFYGGRFALSNFFYNYNKSIELGLDASIAHLKTNKSKDQPDFSKTITIFSPALVARWYFTQYNKLNFFLAGGIGPSYMTNNDFEGRDLGMRFSFQDIGGLGFKTKFNKNEELVLGIYIIHYSNGSLHEDNRGITIPFSGRIAYRF